MRFPWKAKALTQRGLSVLPAGVHLNHVLQRTVTHTYPRTGPVLDEVLAAAERHATAVVAHTGRPIGELRFLEFGAGWDLAGALCMAAQGARHQLLLDLKRLARPRLVRGVRRELAERGVLPNPGAATALGDLLEPLGIEYRAPADARASGPAGRVGGRRDLDEHPRARRP